MHAKRAALLVFRDSLNHRPEDVRIDLLPIQIADVEKIGAGDLAEARRVKAAREQVAIDIGKGIGPSGYPGACPILSLYVHGTEQFADHLVRVGRALGAHLRDSIGKQACSVEDTGVLGEKAEDQPCHEVIHVVAPLGCAPFWVVLKKLDVEAVQPAGRPDVEGVLTDLLDGRDASKRQEEAEMVGKIPVRTGNDFTVRQVLCLKVHTIGRQDELRFRFGGRGALLQRC